LRATPVGSASACARSCCVWSCMARCTCSGTIIPPATHASRRPCGNVRNVSWRASSTGWPLEPRGPFSSSGGQLSLMAVVFALGAALVAALCAFADGALLGLDDEEPPSDTRIRSLLARRELAHRALAFGRIIA